jgi:hypothetical protein
MTDTGGPTTPAGWFTDPGGSGHLRWWDGTAWTAHLAPQPTPAPTPVVPQPVVQQPVLQQPAVQQTVQYEPVEQQSAVLTADDQPYVPFQGAWNHQTAGFGADDAAGFARPMRWNTLGAWLIAFCVLLVLVPAVLIGFFEGAAAAAGKGSVNQTTLSATGLIADVVFAGLLLLFAEMDRRKLRSYGFVHTAAIWWVLLTPLVYLILRGSSIRRETGRGGYGPLIGFLCTIGFFVVAAIAIPAFLVAHSAGSSAAFATSLETGLDQKGGHFTVSCPPTIPTSIGSTFSCTAVDSSGTSHVLAIQVVAGADGKPTVKLQSVTPPISG